VITTPRRATVRGCPVALVSAESTSTAQPSAAVVRVAIRSRSSPGSEPIVQMRAPLIEPRQRCQGGGRVQIPLARLVASIRNVALVHGRIDRTRGTAFRVMSFHGGLSRLRRPPG